MEVYECSTSNRNHQKMWRIKPPSNFDKEAE
jgi:hypothetical protein